METLTIILCLIGLVLSIVVLVKFLQIAADVRAIRQSIPLAYKFSFDDARATIVDAEFAIKTGNKEYARQILLLAKERMSTNSFETYKVLIAQIDKILSDI